MIDGHTLLIDPDGCIIDDRSALIDHAASLAGEGRSRFDAPPRPTVAKRLGVE